MLIAGNVTDLLKIKVAKTNEEYNRILKEQRYIDIEILEQQMIMSKLELRRKQLDMMLDKLECDILDDLKDRIERKG